jgi:hypothetical protein
MIYVLMALHLLAIMWFGVIAKRIVREIRQRLRDHSASTGFLSTEHAVTCVQLAAATILLAVSVALALSELPA